MAATTTTTTSAARNPTLWTRPFILLCLAVMLGYAHQAVMTPTIPLFVDHKGGSALVAGLALLSFSVPSFAVRPYLGHLSDTWSAAGILGFGLVLLAIGGVLFLVPFLAMVFIASIVRGLGWAGLNTGGYTLLAGAAPSSRRGEASGYYTAVTASASVLFPALALWLIDGPGYEVVFLVSVGLAILGVPVARMVNATHVDNAPPPAKAEAPKTSIGVDKGVLMSTGLNLSSTLALPAVTAFLPLYARDIGVSHVGYYYILAGITSILIRPVLGQKSDSMGRGPSVALGLCAQLIGLVFIVAAQNLAMILLGGVFVSLGSAMNSSATTALAMDLANPASRGKAMATFSISFQLGAGIGAILAGSIADLSSYRGMYVGSIVVTLLGLLLLAANWRRLPTPSVAEAAQTP